MRNLTHLPLFAILLMLLFGCSGSNNKDLAGSPFYWPPEAVDKQKVFSSSYFSAIHENNLGRYLFANEPIQREWEDESDFVTVYDMSKMDEVGLYCRWLGAQNAGPEVLFKTFAKNPNSKKRIHLRYDYFIDSIQGDFHYFDKPTAEELTWESSRYPVFAPGVLPDSEAEALEISLTQQNVINTLWKHQDYVRNKSDNTLLLGLKIAVADGTSPGKKADRKTMEMASGQILLTNIDQGLEWISKIPQYSIPEPFVKDKDLEKQGLKLMQSYARNNGWKEKFVKAIVTSVNDRRNKYTGIKTGESVIFGLIGKWPNGTYTIQSFRTFRQNEDSPVSFDGTGKQRNIIPTADQLSDWE
ncbi:hypothetical protein M3P19_08515 [Muricauda sp. 2012CJ35-5]|uniref:Lipoprotein n=1 Tax=Flagellimonas spongiicola TaxID=2942208 RepID=A0ABT0PRP7_9FLAO|nr:hypothetical protein [Allomuricauda spongiicola]MCL6274050.1 hypothetical protein [Allomuricauda spongiicola]